MMLSRSEYVTMSLDLNVFFLRIMKEHSIFLEGSFTPKNKNMAMEAGGYKRLFEGLLSEAVALGNGRVSADAIASGEFFTQYTLRAEQMTQFYTGIATNTTLTGQEEKMSARMPKTALPPTLEQRVATLNRKAMDAATKLANFKSTVLGEVSACRIFTNLYPAVIEHILGEARHYISSLQKLERGEDLTLARNLSDEEVFWNGGMGDHAAAIEGWLDPSEKNLKQTAENFATVFEQLKMNAEAAERQLSLLPGVTQQSAQATRGIRDFKAAATSGTIGCTIKSVMLPLLTDHVLRESNQYLRILLTSREM